MEFHNVCLGLCVLIKGVVFIYLRVLCNIDDNYVYLRLFWHADQMYCIFKSVLG